MELNIVALKLGSHCIDSVFSLVQEFNYFRMMSPPSILPMLILITINKHIVQLFTQ